MIQSELLKTQFATIAKAKAANFRNNCLVRADKLDIDRTLIPMPNEFYLWLMTYEPKLETYRKRLYLRCEYTGEKIKLDDIQIDHKTPISRGGLFGIENLAITSDKTNQYKGSLNQMEFLSLLSLLNTFDEVARIDVLTRLRSGGNRWIFK